MIKIRCHIQNEAFVWKSIGWHDMGGLTGGSNLTIVLLDDIRNLINFCTLVKGTLSKSENVMDRLDDTGFNINKIKVE